MCGCASGRVVRLCSEIDWNDANATCSVSALHVTKSESAREGKIRAALCMCGGWHNSPEHLGETLNSKRDVYKRTPSFRTFGRSCCQLVGSFRTKSSQRGILES